MLRSITRCLISGSNRLALVTLATALLHTGVLQAASEKQVERLKNSQEVLQQIMDTPDKGIPQDLLARAACVGIIPSVKKLALGIGGQHGSGYVICRRNNGKGAWGAPSGFSLSGGSFGLQLGASATDFVLLFMNADGIEKLLQDKFTLGADASVAAGPVGRSAAAATDAQMTAKVLSYSRSKGLFAGIALNGAVLRPSGDDNEELYGRKVNAKDILVTGSIGIPAAAGPLVQSLTRYSSGQTRKPL
jgi:lipid-binding SYLF domain-containing protein